LFYEKLLGAGKPLESQKKRDTRIKKAAGDKKGKKRRINWKYRAGKVKAYF